MCGLSFIFAFSLTSLPCDLLLTHHHHRTFTHTHTRTHKRTMERAQLKNPKLALELYESLLAKQPQLVPAMVGKARALDLLADQRQSNKILEDAIESYHDVVSHADEVDDETLISVAERCIERIRFRGQYLKAVDIHQALIRRFDGEPKYRNQLAVTYLLSNR